MSEERDSTTSCTSTDTKTKKRPFAIPPLSEIKQSNKAGAVTVQPILFRPDNHNLSSHGASGNSLAPEITTQSSHTLKEAGSSVSVTSTADTSVILNHDIKKRKRARNEIESMNETAPKIPHLMTNERVLPQQMGDHKTGSNGTTDCSTSSSSTTRESMRPSTDIKSEGSSSSSSATITSSVHHPHAIIANLVQKRNPVMKHIRNVPWEVGDIVPDFVLGKTTCAMFLSVRYHSLHPNYIHLRLKELGRQYQLRILLVLVDMKECQKALQELAKIAILADLTLMLAWSYEEAGRYLETYKAFENKPPDMLMERIDSDFSSRVTESLTTVKKVNKTDAATLLNNFKTMDKVITASREELVLCPGVGPQKAQRLFTLFHQPFKIPKPPEHKE